MYTWFLPLGGIKASKSAVTILVLKSRSLVLVGITSISGISVIGFSEGEFLEESQILVLTPLEVLIIFPEIKGFVGADEVPPPLLSLEFPPEEVGATGV
jgi:hypothetical protein